MIRCLTLALLMASAALGQIVVQNHTTHAMVASPLLLSDVAVNDFEDVPLDIVNTGAAAATVNSATATGPYFSLCCQSAFVIPAGGTYTVTLRFAPTATGYFSGAIEIDALAIFVFGRSDPAASLFVQTAAGMVQAHSGTPLTVTLGGSTTEELSCLLENNSTGPVTVHSLSASAGWKLSNAPSLPLSLQAGQQASFTLTGTLSASAVAAQDPIAGVVTVDQWTYAIDAHPPQPNVLLQLSGTQLQSGQQATLAVNFDSAPAIVQTGSVTLTLDTAGPISLTDPAILFPSTGTSSGFIHQRCRPDRRQFRGSKQDLISDRNHGWNTARARSVGVFRPANQHYPGTRANRIWDHRCQTRDRLPRRDRDGLRQYADGRKAEFFVLRFAGRLYRKPRHGRLHRVVLPILLPIGIQRGRDVQDGRAFPGYGWEPGRSIPSKWI